MPVVHNKNSGVPDGDDTSVVRPTDWNAGHVVNVDLASEVSGVLGVGNGGLFGATTDNLPEGGSHYYWTQDRFDTAFFAGINSIDTDSIREGTDNVYFRSDRARAALSGGTGIGYNDVTGIITNTGVTSIAGTANKVSVSASTGNVTVTLPNTVNITTLNVDNLAVLTGSAGILRIASSINGAVVSSTTTDNLPQGSTNLYFSDALAQTAVEAILGNGLTFNSLSGNIEVFYNSSNLQIGSGKLDLNSSISVTAAITAGTTVKASTNLLVGAATASVNPGTPNTITMTATSSGFPTLEIIGFTTAQGGQIEIYGGANKYVNIAGGYNQGTAGGTLVLRTSSTSGTIQDVIRMNAFRSVGMGSGQLFATADATRVLQVYNSSGDTYACINSAAASVCALEFNKASSAKWTINVPANSNDLVFTSAGTGGNIGLNSGSFGSGVKVVAIGDVATVPTVTPSAGIILYVDSSGNLKALTKGGNTRIIAAV